THRGVIIMAISVQDINSESAADIDDVWWGLLNAGYVEGTSGAIANAGDSGMGRFPAVPGSLGHLNHVSPASQCRAR
ncbi:MAG: hypothetical protein ACYTEQ_23115, partial [Planctomycetota bacterium]